MNVNTQQWLPMPVVMGAAKYPENIKETLEANAGKVGHAVEEAASRRAEKIEYIEAPENSEIVGELEK